MTRWSVRIQASPGNPDAAELAGSPEERTFVIEESLGYLLNRAARVMARELAERLRPADVGIGQWAVLLFLWARDGVTQAELAKIVSIEPPTMVRTIDRMVRDGLVTRTADASDGRITRIHLTDRGRSLGDTLLPHAVAVNEAIGGRLTASESRTLRRLLVKLVREPGGDGRNG
jgi:DNA-binding MarR family transcriptional regulator